MIERLVVPAAVIDATERAIQEAGDHGHELFVLWSGRADGATFAVDTYHVPPQTAYRTPLGCGVRVDGPALHDLNVWLYTHSETLGVQLHSHPTEAFHSGTDDAYAIVTAEGCLSIVVADFARHGLMADSTAVYRLEAGEWQPFGVTVEVI